EELLPPIAVFIGPPVKQEISCTREDKEQYLQLDPAMKVQQDVFQMKKYGQRAAAGLLQGCYLAL
ncbi:Protein of unknown function, partial [Gryllus bimaculatus]